MSEAELIEAATSFLDLGISTFAIWLSLTSGFLIVAYLVGQQLSRFQYLVLNWLYGVTAAIAGIACAGYAGQGLTYAAALQAMAAESTVSSGSQVSPGNWFLAVSVTLFFAALIAGEVAAICFMRSIRRGAREQA